MLLQGKWQQLAALVAVLPSLVQALPSSLGFDNQLDSASLFEREVIVPDTDPTTEITFTGSKSPEKRRWPQGFHFATDYYPNQWPEFLWESDAERMANASLSYVRINEFDWAILEPEEGKYDFSTLDRSIEVLGSKGLKVILGTPTATPPIWAVRNYDILGADTQGRERRFGSRRHYSFSAPDYRMLSKRITTALAKRYGNNEHVVGWQLDNEFGCHGTTRTYDKHAEKRFQGWLQDKYNHNITLFNQRQGRVFWSQDYQSFDQIKVPLLEVTESTPAHRLDFYDFSSDMVIEFAKEQTDIIRQHSDRFITTNFMGYYNDFDHYKFAKSIGMDLATWDSYPLGNTEQFSWISDDDKLRYGRTGMPDSQSLMHNLYRGISGAAYNKTAGPWGIMEQQPGPVNWAPFNPSPRDGMPRMWAHEILAHSGTMVNYFRWREVPYAQEQMHAAFNLRNNEPDVLFFEQQKIVNEDLPALQKSGLTEGEAKEGGSNKSQAPVFAEEPQADVALVWDYKAQWLLEVEPQSGTWDTNSNTFTNPSMYYNSLVYNWYSALRRLGLSVDVIGPYTKLDGYKMVAVPTMPIVHDEFDKSFSKFNGTAVFGPRSASKVATLDIPDGLIPAAGAVREALPMVVTRVETTKPGFGDMISYAGEQYNISGWSEWIQCSRGSRQASVAADQGAAYHGYRDGKPITCAHDDGKKTTHYIGAYTPVEFLISYFADAAKSLGLKTLLGTEVAKDAELGKDLRLVRSGKALWALNYGPEAVELPATPEGAELVLGGADGKVAPADVAVWKLP
ncbi:uncharacterized protein PFL1_00281 [Pseudozyma flocculosa PF-1]|uniref:beta-galactosidase n=1 Tax=Pseudozyma flocculosa TaxID=84751 RepID=A0A5C3EU34_9BASI|nr:uncharacterized protein PFL1_00281 [Pseudozyma flocculosa PF-1]EPQ32083.1 hypothetical protein PFL1_00281 [Pseudozyma flocculosa PF-1]SPO34987.1 related to beta-galactosidase [Pseudozyma flocculosa]